MLGEGGLYHIYINYTLCFYQCQNRYYILYYIWVSIAINIFSVNFYYDQLFTLKWWGIRRSPRDYCGAFLSTRRSGCVDGGGGGNPSISSMVPKSVVRLRRHRTSERVTASCLGVPSRAHATSDAVPPLSYATADAVPPLSHATAEAVIGTYDGRQRKSATGAPLATGTPSVTRTADVVAYTASTAVSVHPRYVERLSADDGHERRSRWVETIVKYVVWSVNKRRRLHVVNYWRWSVVIHKQQCYNDKIIFMNFILLYFRFSFPRSSKWKIIWFWNSSSLL